MDIARSARVGNRFSSLVAGGLALVVTLAAAASPTPHTAVTSDKGVLSGVSADSPADAWAAGGPGSTLMLHWTGSSWAQTAVPAGDNLFSVSADLHALSSTDAWAAGAVFPNQGIGNSLVLHWNGSAWTRS